MIRSNQEWSRQDEVQEADQTAAELVAYAGEARGERRRGETVKRNKTQVEEMGTSGYRWAVAEMTVLCMEREAEWATTVAIK